MQYAILAGLNYGRRQDFEKSMRETAALAEDAGIHVAGYVTQSLDMPVSGTLIGKGKIEELKETADEAGADLILFDNSLTPVQHRNLNQETGYEILDRTGLILRIFSDRAQTREARLQVESASLSYMLPRLAGMHTELGRQAGGSGSRSNKGLGEKKLELDRRHIEHRLSELRRELAGISEERATQRKRRLRAGIRRAALVGYTNAGKSTILNEMLKLYGQDEGKQVTEADMLFATLDTSTREIRPGKQTKPFLLSDTVGFISNLPTTLVKAFRSTLDEITYADVLVIVSDLSDPDCLENLKVTTDTITEIGAGAIPRIYVFNKADQCEKDGSYPVSVPHMTKEDRRITLSAKSPDDIARLAALIGEVMNAGAIECDMLIPYQDGGAITALKKRCDLTVTGYAKDGTCIHLICPKEEYERYKAYLVSDSPDAGSF